MELQSCEVVICEVVKLQSCEVVICEVVKLLSCEVAKFSHIDFEYTCFLQKYDFHGIIVVTW